jgi:Txe/YoeB family toxin of Txe-Axe toxin-antitoxin module
LKLLIVDTFANRKFTNFDKYEPLTEEEQNNYIREYNRNHKPKISVYSRNPMQIEVFKKEKLIYDIR